MTRDQSDQALPRIGQDWTVGPAKYTAAIVLLTLIAGALVVGWERATVSVPRTPTEPTATLRINVNDATRAELELLPGVGTALAQRIIDSRTQQGKFRSLADLQRVSGIGASGLHRIRTFIRYD
ncbi:MAG: ComEA family DNA-binding protein [Phycisphaerales bacterium]|nr:ComEA family DNA-binding protein [Phycisphaerales bacterium]